MDTSTKNVKTINDLLPGQKGTVSTILGFGAIRQRLLDVGILPRVRVEIERVAPSGDPIWIKAGGLHLSLRREEAQHIVLEGL